MLIVEDSELVTDALAVLLEGSGYRVSVARNLAEGRERLASDPADVLLLDLSLADGDGLSLLGDMAPPGRRPRATFALTGHADDETRARCMAAGCDDVLVKPVAIRELLRRIAEATS